MSGKLRAEQVRKTVEKHWHDLPAEYDMPEATALSEYSYDWQAIADELNATLGDGGYRQAAEYWQRMYEETFAERTCHDTDENDWHFVCLACGYEQNGYEQWNYCPNCGCKVVGE